METYLNQPTRIKFRPDIYGVGFAKIFWGLLIAILDITINSLDFLPDIVGFYLVASGSGRLRALSNNFEAAKVIAIVSAICWLIGLFLPADLQFGFGVVMAVLSCLMIWHLMDGIAEYATSRSRRDLAEKAKNRGAIYIVVTAISYFVVLFGTHNGTFGPLGFLVFGAFLFVLVLILHLIHRVKTEIAI